MIYCKLLCNPIVRKCQDLICTKENYWKINRKSWKFDGKNVLVYYGNQKEQIIIIQKKNGVYGYHDNQSVTLNPQNTVI